MKDSGGVKLEIKGIENSKEKSTVAVDAKLEISLSVVLGTSNSTITRILENIRGTQAVILVSSSRTHNFMDHSIMQKSRLLINTTTLPVNIANGEMIRSKGNHLKLIFYILFLGSFDVILG